MRLIDADVLIDGYEDNYEFCEAVNNTPTVSAIPIDRIKQLREKTEDAKNQLTYKDACIMYLEKNMECVGYRDYIIKQLNRLEQVECVVDAYITDNHKEPIYDTEDYMNSIREILERGNTDGSNFRELPPVTPTKCKCEKLADGINSDELDFTHYARLTPEEAEYDLFRLDKETGEYIPLTDCTHYALPETSEQFKDIKRAVIQGCANMMKAVGEKL